MQRGRGVVGARVGWAGMGGRLSGDLCLFPPRAEPFRRTLAEQLPSVQSRVALRLGSEYAFYMAEQSASVWLGVAVSPMSHGLTSVSSF